MRLIYNLHQNSAMLRCVECTSLICCCASVLPRWLCRQIRRMRLGIAEDIALGMKSLYAQGMQHRHLTSNSVLLTSDYRAKVRRGGNAAVHAEALASDKESRRCRSAAVEHVLILTC